MANLKLHSSFTGANLDRVFDATQCFYHEVMDYVKDSVKEFLQEKYMNMEDPELEKLINKFEVIEPFEGIYGPDGHIAALKKYYEFIDPIEIPLGTRIDRRFNGKKKEYEAVPVNETLQYVPIIETLKLLMSHREVGDYINSENNAPEGCLHNFRDATNFKVHAFFKKFPQALRIQLCYDDLVVNNPLG